VTYTPGGGAVALDGTVSDPDGALLTGATLYFTGGSLPGDMLSFTPQSGISGVFSGGTLTLSGTASAAAYQAALQSVQYGSTDGDAYGNGADPSRTIAIVLSDGNGSSAPGAAYITIDPVTIDIPDGSAVSLGNISAGRDAVFLGTGTLDLTSPAGFAGSISSFGGGDTIMLEGLSIASESYASGTLTLFDGLGAVLESLTLGEPGSITSADFHLVSGGAGGTDITLCFYPGTRIATPAGEVAVEALRPGDMVLSLPIRISAGALGDGLPRRDLLLSPDHALLIGTLLVQAGALVNGSSIRREHGVPEQFTYYHLELDHHALLLAEGALTESFVDNVDRMHFHNWDTRTAPATRIAELPYPRAKSARQLPPRIRARLGGKAEAVA
jgi:Hint domain